jgi:pyruvate decarboxylase
LLLLDLPACLLFCSSQGKLFAVKAATEPELIAALQTALTEKKDHVCFIELALDTHDCSKELLEFGARVSNANGRPPVAQNMLH